MSNGEFKNDLKYGQKYEIKTQARLLELEYKIILVSQGYIPEYDFIAISPNGKEEKYEVKTTKREYQTIFIEFENGNGKPSGIHKTTSDKYIFVEVSKEEDENERYYMINTTKLKEIIKKKCLKVVKNKFKGEQGYLVKKNDVFLSSLEL